MINQTVAIKNTDNTKILVAIDWQVISRLFLLTIIASLLYLMISFISQTTSDAFQTSTLADLEKQAVNLREENASLEVSLIGASSIEKLMPAIAQLNFEKAENISFIKVTGDKVVVNAINKVE